MEYNIYKERYVKLRNTIEDIFEGTTEELNACIQSYDSILREKNDEITEVELKMLINFFINLYTYDYGHSFIGLLAFAE